MRKKMIPCLMALLMLAAPVAVSAGEGTEETITEEAAEIYAEEVDADPYEELENPEVLIDYSKIKGFDEWRDPDEEYPVELDGEVQEVTAAEQNTASHEHVWEAVYSPVQVGTVHHEAVTHEEDVYEEQETWDSHRFCNKCETDLSLYDEDTQVLHLLEHNCGWHDLPVYYITSVKVGTKTVIDTPAWDEPVYEDQVTGYACSICGIMQKKTPVLSFADESVIKTYGDDEFHNALTAETDGELEYFSSNDLVAFVEEDGNVVIFGTGSAVIGVRSSETDEYFAGIASFMITVNKNPGDLSFEEANVEKLVGDEPFTNPLIAKWGRRRKLAYTSSDEAVATVDSKGQVTINGKGTCTITASAEEDDLYYAGEASYTLTVTDFDTPHVSYRARVIGKGWQESARDGEEAGTTGKSLIMEAFEAGITNEWGNTMDDSLLGIEYSSHVQNVGWGEWVSNWDTAGRPGLRTEAIKMRLTGKYADRYDIYYCLHCQNYGWLGWAKNGEESGTAGMSLRVEAIRIMVLPKGSTAPAKPGKYTETYMFSPEIRYSSYVQGQGWQKEVKKNNLSGTLGQSLRLEGFKIRVVGEENLGVKYCGHVQNVGWMNYVADNAACGKPGQGLRIEALQLELTGADKDKYDIYYCLHVQNFGWLAWAKNGERSGSSGVSMRVEGYAIKILPKNSPKPKNLSSRTEAFVDGIGASKLTLNRSSASVKRGNTVQLKATILPENRTFKGARWTSSNPAVATVSNGTVTGKKKGTTTITCTSNDGRVKDTCRITVY